MGGLPGEREKRSPGPGLPGDQKMDYEKEIEKKSDEQIKDYSDLMALAYSVMDLDMKITALIRAKSTAEEKYKKAHIAYYEKYPEA